MIWQDVKVVFTKRYVCIEPIFKMTPMHIWALSMTRKSANIFYQMLCQRARLRNLN